MGRAEHGVTGPDVIRVGVVGLRFGAQVHVPAFRANAGCDIVAIAGRDGDRAASIAHQLDIPQSYGDWRSLLALADVDAVSLAVPPEEQASIIPEAARLGKHVFCEKPLAATVHDAEFAAESVRHARVVHAMDFIFPELSAWQFVRQLLRDGAIGAPRHFSYAWRVQTFSSRTAADSWKTRTAAGGGAAGNFLSHVVFNIEWLFGELVSLDALPRHRGVSAQSFSDCVVSLAAGIHGVISISTDAYLGEGHEVRIYGQSGTLVLRNPTSDYAEGFEVAVGTRQSGHLERAHHVPSSGRDGRIEPVSRIAGRFLDAIRTKKQMTPNLDDGVRIQRWIQRANAVQQGHRGGA